MLFDAIRQEIFDRIKAVLPPESGAEAVLELPPDQAMGDFAFPTYRLAKALRKAPPIIAMELAEKLAADPIVAKHCDVTTAGPYCNFRVKREVLLKEVLDSLLLTGGKLAEKSVTNPAPVILEFSSPNVAKPFNIYHLRSTMIGNCLSRVYKARGHNVVSINHLGDWGTQYGTLALAYESWGDDKQLDERGIEYLVELYVRINKLIEEEKSLADGTSTTAVKAREYFSRLEKGDAKVRELWKKFIDLSLKEFNSTYKRLGVHFDHFWGESFYIDKVPALEKALKEKNLLVESQGAQVVDLEKFGMPPCIVRKADGSTIYHTRDLAAAIYRKEKLGFQKMIYIVGGEQKLHFQQLFKVLELMGLEWSKACQHISFGLYRFKDAKMSTRKGNFVTLEAVLDHAVDRVKQIMAEKDAQAAQAAAESGTTARTPMSAAERERAAEIIGTGAIVYNDLSTDLTTDVNFDLERVCDFDGETGPYIQYAHTRCLGILRHAPAELLADVNIPALLDLNAAQPGFKRLYAAASGRLNETEELDLIRTLAQLPLVLDQVIEGSRPSTLGTYLIDITKSFNTFYRAHKVLVEDAEMARARLALVLATQRTLLKSLTLLGMTAPERM